VQAGALCVTGGDFGFTVGLADADIADFIAALCFGNDIFVFNLLIR